MPDMLNIHIASVAFNTLLLESIQRNWDMYHGSHEMAEYRGETRAVGGCAVYGSDKPAQHDFNLLKKDVLPNGSITGTIRAQDANYLPRVAFNKWKGYDVVYSHLHGDFAYVPKGTPLPITREAQEYEMFNSRGAIKEVKVVGTVDMKARGCGPSGANSSARPMRIEVDAEEEESGLVMKNYQIVTFFFPVFLSAGPVRRIKSRIPGTKIICNYFLKKFFRT